MLEPATNDQKPETPAQRSWVTARFKQHGFWSVVVAIAGFVALFASQIFEEQLGEKNFSRLLIASSIFTILGCFLTLAYIKLQILDARRELVDSLKTNLDARQRHLGILAARFDEIVKTFQAISKPGGGEDRHLSVVAPVGQWLHTSSWDEIVKKMRDMLKMHDWGQVPAYSEMRYLVSLNQIKPHDFGFQDATLQNKTNFVKVNFFQTSGLDWDNFRYNDHERKEEDKKVEDRKEDDEKEPLHRRAVLFDALKNALSTYVVMPYNDYATTEDKEIVYHCSAVYPLSPQAIKKFSALYETGESETLALLRRLPWKGPCDHSIFQEVTQADGEFPKIFNSLADNLQTTNRDKSSSIDTNGDEPAAEDSATVEQVDHSWEYAFSVNIVFQDGQKRHVEKIRYLSMFNAEGVLQTPYLTHMPETDSGIDWASVLCKTENNIIGCYAPYTPDVEKLRAKCSSIQSGDWRNIRIAFNWSYLHLQSMTVAGERYANNSWSFQIFSVGRLKRAEFRDDGENIRFENETAVIPYTMKALDLLPTPTENGGRSKVVFEGPTAFATSPSDVFHISWADPEVSRLEEENENLKEENDRLEQENDRLKEEKPQPGGAQSSNPPAKVENLTISNRAS